MIHFLVERKGEFGINDYLSLWGRELADRIRVIHYESLPARRSLQTGTYILAGLDQLRPEGRRMVLELQQQLLAAGAGIRILNSPTRSLLRFELLAELHRLGLNRHRALRATQETHGLRFPVFLRSEHSHEGALTPLLHNQDELAAALGTELLRGRRAGELLVVEFWDTADAGGRYRKYGAFIVGQRIIARNLSLGREWMQKQAATEFDAEWCREEEQYVRDNPHQAELQRVAAIARVEYGRIDYSVRDGAIAVWEINLNPTIGRGARPSSGSIPAALQPLRQTTKELFYAKFNAALREVDSPGPGREIPIRLPHLRESAITRPGQPARRRSALYRAIRPIQPMVRRLMALLAPLLGRLRLGRPSRPPLPR